MLFQSASPAWFIALAFAAAVIAAGGLYWKNRKDELDRKWRIALSILRFGFVFCVCILLFLPVTETTKEETRKPVCFLALDQSFSMQGAFADTGQALQEASTDSSNPASPFLQATLKGIEHLGKKLENDFRVEEIAFGATARKGFGPVFSSPATNYQALFERIKSLSPEEGNACVVLISDGNPNTGSEPSAAYRACALPLFTVAIGDTTRHPDIFIGQVQHNRYARKGNVFPVRIHIGKDRVGMEAATLELSCQGKTIRKERIDLGQTEEIEWEIPAEETGAIRYELRLAPLPGEKNVQNNRAGFTVQVMDEQRKILIIAQSPHPDISALKQAFERNGNYEVQAVACQRGQRLEAGTGLLDEADLIILHGLPSKEEDLGRFATSLERKPLWYVITPSTSLQAFNQLPTGIRIHARNHSWNEAQALFNRDFSQFEASDGEIARYLDFPPLHCPFARYETLPGGQAVFYQSILQTPTRDPLAWIGRQGQDAVLVIAGQGLWKWPLADFQTNGNTGIFDRLMERFVQLTTAPSVKENLVIDCPQTLSESQRLVAGAQLYNASFEKVSRAEIQFLLKNENDGKEYAFEFLPEGLDYRLDAGFLPEGDYTYLASCRKGNEHYQASGRIRIQESRIENPQLPANLNLLRNLSLAFSGKSFYAGSFRNPNPDVWESLYQEIRQRNDLEPQISYRKTAVSLIDRKFLLVLLLCLLSTEYFLRKLFGNL